MYRLFIALFVVVSMTSPSQELNATLTWHQKVAEPPGHHAFTDLVRFKGYYYLCNRVGSGHVSMDGVIEIRRSTDMKVWEDCGTIKTLGDDRDPHFVATEDRLYLFFGVWDTLHGTGNTPPERHNVRSHMASTEDGTTWSAVQGLYEPGWWLWRVRMIDDMFYSVAYTALRPVPEFRESRLLRSPDGIQWELVSTITRDFMAGEADLWRRDKESFAVLSRTGGSEPARLFSSDASLRVWENVPMNAMVHSPVVAFWYDHIFVAGRGEVDGKHVTKLWELHGVELRELMVLPSGGDNAYPGLIPVPESLEKGDPRLYISWYSQTDADTGEKEPNGGAGVYVGEITLTHGQSE